MMKKALLTFDVEGPPQREDFADKEILIALHRVLKLLEKYDLKGLFFITASVAEKIGRYPGILELLRVHEIGYHSSSHSVKPGILEYTDIKSYEKAIETSKERETSRIDLFTGTIIGKGGIPSLRKIFPEKKITAFRAPFLCWSPPHLEALRELGFRFDFSSNICRTPVFFKGINFMPYPVVIDSMFSNFPVLVKKMMIEPFIVFLMHPSHMVFKLGESSYFEYNNLFRPVRIESRSEFEIEFKFFELESLLSCLHFLQRKGLIELQNSLTESIEILDLNKVDVRIVYERSIFAAKRFFGYEPKFLLSHFYRFLEE